MKKSAEQARQNRWYLYRELVVLSYSLVTSSFWVTDRRLCSFAVLFYLKLKTIKIEQANNVPLNDAATERATEVRVKTEPETVPEENVSPANDTTGVNVEKAKKQTRPRQAQCPKTLPRPIVSSNTIELHAMFKNRPEFLQVLNDFSNRTCQRFRKFSSSNNPNLLTRDKISDFEYKLEVYQCVHSGKPRKRGKGKRPNQTYLGLGCPAIIRVNLDYKLKALVITTCKLKHNHPLTPDVLDKEGRKKFAKTFSQVQERAASEANSSSGTSSLSEAGSSSASGGSSGASSSSETSSSGSSSQLSMTALQNCIDNFVNYQMAPVQILLFLSQVYPNLPPQFIAQLVAAAFPDAINSSVAEINAQPEPVDPEQPSAVNTLAPEGTTSVTPLTNIEAEPSSSVQNAGNTDNQENEQTGYDHLDQFLEEIENYAPVNDLKAMQEIVGTLRSIRNGIPH